MTTAPAACAPAAAPEPAPPVHSPEVHEDERVTFRLRAPLAKEVCVHLEGSPGPLPMSRESSGIWTVTTGPLAPDLYGYSFTADGMEIIDPANALLKPNLLNTQNIVHVPGPASLLWEVGDVPHGAVHRHFYSSTVVGDRRDYYVYTPPGYDPTAPQVYPVLYLLHGFSDDASGWTAIGRANFILDNLIARGAAKPMVIVMPLGYGAPEILGGGFAGFFANRALLQRNFDRFGESLLTEVIPRVEAGYHVSADRGSRAIAGLSMGGSESLLVGLNHLDRFAWIGAFSAGGLSEDFDHEFPRLERNDNARIHLLWVACGTEDSLIGIHRKLRLWLESKGVAANAVETAGGHVWMLWRRQLAELAGRLFR